MPNVHGTRYPSCVTPRVRARADGGQGPERHDPAGRVQKTRMALLGQAELLQLCHPGAEREEENQGGRSVGSLRRS